MPGYNLAMRNIILENIAANVGGGTNTLQVLDAANLVLATHSNIPAFPAVNNGSTQLTTVTDSTIGANGTATKVRVTKGTAVNEYTVAAGEVTFGDANYVVNGVSKVTSITLNYPTGGI
jgi:hypothetical protein